MSTITLKTCYFRGVTRLDQNPCQWFWSNSHIILSRKCTTSVYKWEVLTTFPGRATSTITLQTCYFRAVTRLDQNPCQWFWSNSHIILSMKWTTSVYKWEVLTTFPGWATSTITLQTCYFRAVTRLDQNPCQWFWSNSHIILSRKCTTSVYKWEVLTTFPGRATSTITLQTCYFRAVTRLDQNPCQWFWSNSHIILSRKCTTNVYKWEVLTTFPGWATSTITLQTCYFRAVTRLDQNPCQWFWSNSHIILSRKCTTSVYKWEVLTTFPGWATSTITLQTCYFKAVTRLDQNPCQWFWSNSHMILSRKCTTSVYKWEVLTTFPGWATSTITLQTCYFRAVTRLDQNPCQWFWSNSHIILSRKCTTSVYKWEVLTTFPGWATSTITLQTCYFRAVTRLDQNPCQWFWSNSHIILSMKWSTSVYKWEVLTTFPGWATSTITLQTCYFRAVTRLDQNPCQWFWSNSHMILSRKCTTSVYKW